MNPWLHKHGYAKRALVCFSNVKPHQSAGRQVFGAGGGALQIHECSFGHWVQVEAWRIRLGAWTLMGM